MNDCTLPAHTLRLLHGPSQRGYRRQSLAVNDMPPHNRQGMIDARSTAFFARLGHGAFDCGFADDPHDLHRRKGRIRAICCASRSTDRDWQRLRRSLALVDAASFARHAIHLDSLRTRLHNARIPVVKTVFASRALIAEIYKAEHPDANEAGKIPEEGQLFEALIRYGL